MLDFEKYGIKFIDEDHYFRFNKMMRQAGRERIDSEYSSCLYVLSSNKTVYEKSLHAVSRDGICVNSLLKNRTWSTTESYLIKIAVALFNRIESLKFDMYWVVRLDEEQFGMIYEAFRIRRHF